MIKKTKNRKRYLGQEYKLHEKQSKLSANREKQLILTRFMHARGQGFAEFESPPGNRSREISTGNSF